ncbi:MAG: hypothetical protein WB791_00910 [Waddliaceae bacterium]
MKRFAVFCVLLFIGFLFGIRFLGPESTGAQVFQREAAAISLQVEETAVIDNPDRLGINLGQWTSWGAEQFSRNVLMNPGFEATIDRILIIVSRADVESFSDEAGWGYPDYYWNEADYRILTGSSAAKRGTIKQSLNSGKSGFPEYFSHDPLPPIEENDIIVLTKVQTAHPVDLWEIDDLSTVGIDTKENRRESEGSQSLRLLPRPGAGAKVFYHLDSISYRAGKMLPIKGEWNFSVWAKAAAEGAALDVSLQRLNGEAPIFRQTIHPTTGWQQYSFDFAGKDNGPPGALQLTLSAARPNTALWIDDLFLGQVQQTPSPFRDALISLLRQLRPSFLREFPHLGDTLENRLAPPYKRKPWTSHLAGNRIETVFGHSLAEFLDLCSLVGANPWIIIPTTFSPIEYQKLGKFLANAAPADRFSEVIVEFGNENWNWFFRPAGIPYSKEHGEMAKTAFTNILLGMGGWVNVRLLVNGEYTIPQVSLQFLDQTPNADGLAIAPYFFHRLESGTPDAEALQSLFEEDRGTLREIADEVYDRDKSLAVYELNLNTTQGDAKAYERDRIVSGAASGSALAKKILEALFLGANPVMVFNLFQYDTRTWETNESVKLWGIARHFGPPLRLRPTGLAVEMLNRAISGDMYRIVSIDQPSPETEKLTLAAFKSNRSWTAVAISENPQQQELDIHFPDDEHPLPTKLMTLNAASPFDTNEEEENVSIVENTLPIQGRLARIIVPAWGLVVLVGDAQ